MSNYTKVSLYIIALFTLAIVSSFILEQFPTFFGDMACNIRAYHYGQTWEYDHSHWGYRHWLFFMMSCSLFIVGFIKIVNEILHD